MHLYILLGQVQCAKAIFLHNKEKYTKIIKSKQTVVDILAEDNSFTCNGYYHDGVWISTPSNSELAEAELNVAKSDYVTFVIPLEKFYKKLKHEFVEQYPDHLILLDT